MVTEIAIITVDPARAADFEAAIAKAVPIFRAAEGCRSLSLSRVVEHPGQYQLVADWDTIEHHTVKFRSSEAFKDWRALVGSFFAVPPVVTHSTLVAKHF